MSEYYTKSSIQQNSGVENESESKSVVKSKPTVGKKSPFKILTGMLFAEDIPTMLGNLTREVLIPSSKKLMLDLINKGSQHLINGSATSSSKDTGERVSYRNYYDDGRKVKSSSPTTVYSSSYVPEPLRWTDEEDAKEVLNRMYEQLEEKGEVSVGHYYVYSNYGTKSTDFEFGWTSLRGSEIKHIFEDGEMKHYIKLPRPKALR